MKILKKITIQQNKDIFGIENQFNNWINTDSNIPILFLNFDEVLDKKNILDNFFDTKLNYNLFNFKKRTSNIEDNLIYQIYDKLYLKMINSIINSTKENIIK